MSVYWSFIRHLVSTSAKPNQSCRETLALHHSAYSALQCVAIEALVMPVLIPLHGAPIVYINVVMRSLPFFCLVINLQQEEYFILYVSNYCSRIRFLGPATCTYSIVYKGILFGVFPLLYNHIKQNKLL